MMNMIRKGQIAGAEKGNIAAQNQFIAELFGLTAQAKNGRFVSSCLPKNQSDYLQLNPKVYAARKS